MSYEMDSILNYTLFMVYGITFYEFPFRSTSITYRNLMLSNFCFNKCSEID